MAEKGYGATVMDEVCKRFADHVRPLGFRQRGRYFRSSQAEVISCVHFQGSDGNQFATADGYLPVEFFVNLVVYLPAIDEVLGNIVRRTPTVGQGTAESRLAGQRRTKTFEVDQRSGVTVESAVALVIDQFDAQAIPFFRGHHSPAAFLSARAASADPWFPETSLLAAEILVGDPARWWNRYDTWRSIYADHPHSQFWIERIDHDLANAHIVRPT